MYLSDTLSDSTNSLRRISEMVFDSKSLFTLILTIIIASILGRFASAFMRRASSRVGRQADASTNLTSVNRLRRIETWIILFIAVVRVLLLIIAIYFWWLFSHPGQQPTALVGASALLIVVIGGVFGPILRDLAFGGGMMAEHWFGVGDLVTIEPFAIQGVVERITLRSTRIRGLNGEVIWVSNQNISSVSIAQKGTLTMAIELFVSDDKAAERLVDQVNTLLPTGPSLVVSPLRVMTTSERSKDLWHLTAVAEIAPGRNWLIENTAIDLLKGIDEKNRKPILVTDPVARWADNDTERKFARAVTNAKKTRQPKRKITRPSQAKPRRK